MLHARTPGLLQAIRSQVLALVSRPVRIGRLTLPPPGLLVLASLGAALLVAIAMERWGALQDEHAYWAAGERLYHGLPLYDPTAGVQTPYAYWYPPPMAQVLAPLTPFLPDLAFSLAWTAVMIVCLLGLARWQLLVMLALVAYLPVAVEFWYRNVHLVLAALAVLALRRWPMLWVPATAIKLTPVIGLAYLAASGKWREAVKVGAVGMGVVAVSVLISPDAWRQFLEVAVLRGTADSGAFVAIPYPIRLAAAFGLAVAGGRIGGRRGESLLIFGLLVGNPTLWTISFSYLVALLPIWWDGRLGPVREPQPPHPAPGSHARPVRA